MLSPPLPTRTSYPDPSYSVFSDTESCRFNEADQVISLSSHLSYTNRRDTQPPRKERRVHRQKLPVLETCALTICAPWRRLGGTWRAGKESRKVWLTIVQKLMSQRWSAIRWRPQVRRSAPLPSSQGWRDQGSKLRRRGRGGRGRGIGRSRVGWGVGFNLGVGH